VQQPHGLEFRVFEWFNRLQTTLHPFC